MFSPSSSTFRGQIKSKKGRRVWWLFHATDFQSLMYPCFTFCRILGIFPYKINGSVFETSKPFCIISAVIMCAFCSCILILMKDISGWFNIQNICKIIELNSYYISGSFITIISYVLNGPRMHLFQSIMKNSSRLPTKMYQKQSMLVHAKDIFGFLFLFVYTSICYSYMPSVPLFIDMATLYMTLVVFQMDMLYINCVCVIKACFKKINDDLANLLVMNSELHSVRWIYNEQRKSSFLMELTVLKKQHLMVSNSVQMLNIIFSPQLLATITIIFIQITLEIYFNVVQWQNGVSIKWQNSSIFVMVYVVLYLLKIALIAWVCATGKNEAIKISTTVHDVLNSTSDEQIKHELQLFSLQIMHCDNTFSAKGFTLDATLVTTVISTVATYLLILIQFLISSHSCDGKIAINVTQTI